MPPNGQPPVAPDYPEQPAPPNPNDPRNYGPPQPYRQPYQQQPAWPPVPPQPSPYNPAPNQPYGYGQQVDYFGQHPSHGGVPAKPQSRRKGIVASLAVVVVLVAGGGGIFAYLQGSKVTPEKVFEQSLYNALSTSSFTQVNTVENNRLSLKYDVSDVKKPRVSGVADIDLYKIKISGYGDSAASFFKIEPTGDGSVYTAEDGYVNTWVQFKRNGQAPEGSAGVAGLLGVSYVTEARAGILNDYFFGNFSSDQQQTLVRAMLDSNVYTYDPQQVTEETLNGQQVFKYSVTIDTGALIKINEQIAPMVGASDKELQDVKDNLSEDGRSIKDTLYIGIDDPRLLKVELSGENVGEVVAYGGFNATDVGSAPEPEAQWSDFESAEDVPAGTGARQAVPTTTSTQIPQLVQ